MKVRTLFLGILVADILVSIANGQALPCGCADKADLLDQLNRSNAALNEIAQLQKTIPAGASINQKASEPNASKTWKEVISDTLDKAVNPVADSGARHGPAYADPTCQQINKGETACLRAFVERVKLPRQRVCEFEMKSGDVGSYMRVVSDMFNAEIAEVLKLLRPLQKSCLKDWFGTITYNETRSLSSNDRTSSGTAVASTDTIIRSGAIKLNGDPDTQVGSWQVGGRHTETKDSSGMRACTGGLKTANANTPYETHYREEFDRSGSSVGNLKVNIGEPSENSIGIDFQLPEIKVLMNGNRSDVRTSGCPNDNLSKTEPIVMDTIFDPQRYSFDATFFPGDLQKISGTGAQDMLPPIKNDKMSMSNTIRVTYNLYRFVK